MLHRAFRIRNTYWSSRHAVNQLRHLPRRYPPIQLNDSLSQSADTSGQLPGDGNPSPWRRTPNGPAYQLRDGSVELISPSSADAQDGRHESALDDNNTFDLDGDTTTRFEASPDRVRFWIQWKTYFQQLFPLKENDRASAHKLFDSERAESLEFVGEKSFSKLRQQWDKLPQSEQNRIVPRVLVGCITTSADQTLRLLNALPTIFMDFDVRMDCLLYLKRVHWDEMAGEPRLKRMFEFLVRKQLQCWRWPLFQMKFKHLHIFLEHCSANEISKLMDKSVHVDSIPNPATTLAIVDFFTRHRDYERALCTFRMLPRDIIAASEPHVLQRCTNLLKLDFVERKSSSQNFRILPELLEFGIRPDTILHTVVIQNACAAGMSGVAWDLFRYMQAEKLPINSVTYLILLKDTYIRQDVRGLNEILTAIHQREDLARDPHLVVCTMNIVRVICMFERKDWPEVTFSHMLAVYDRAFNRRELVKLGMVGGSNPPVGNSELPPPDSASLAFAIWSYVLAQKLGRIVNTLWLRLVRLLAEKDETATEAAKHPAFYDGFVIFYGRYANSLPKALDVVQHMLDHDLCQPSEKTWTFLIYAFLRHGQQEAAEKIRGMMSDRGITPSVASWDRIVNRWPDSNIATEARLAMEWEARQLKPHFQQQGQDGLFDDLPESGETFAGTESALAFAGWSEMIDLRPTLDSADKDILTN
jgi:pentatricopeptide repeat protein